MALKVPRSDSIASINSYGMKCIIKQVVKNPGFPFRLGDLQIRCDLKRNDMINIRRQIKKISDGLGAIRFIEPDRTHIVYIEDSIESEREVDAILASAVALAHLNAKLVKKRAKPEVNLTHYILDIINRAPTL